MGALHWITGTLLIIGELAGALVLFTVFIFAAAFLREGFHAWVFARKIRAAEVRLYGKPNNKLLNLWWHVFSGPHTITVQHSQTGVCIVVRRKNP